MLPVASRSLVDRPCFCCKELARKGWKPTATAWRESARIPGALRAGSIFSSEALKRSWHRDDFSVAQTWRHPCTRSRAAGLRKREAREGHSIYLSVCQSVCLSVDLLSHSLFIPFFLSLIHRLSGWEALQSTIQLSPRTSSDSLWKTLSHEVSHPLILSSNHRSFDGLETRTPFGNQSIPTASMVANAPGPFTCSGVKD